MANSHKRYNGIDLLGVEGQVISELEAIKSAIQSYYQKLYKEIEELRPDFNIQGATIISFKDEMWLQRVL